MLKRIAVTAAALSAPGIALTIASERIIRTRLFYTGDWHSEPPDAVGFPHEEAHIYTADGLELQGWFFKAGADAPTLLFCHGTSYNASDMWLTPERITAFGNFLRGIGCNFLIFDYRGYGRNGGAPTEERTVLDAAAALAWLYQREDVDAARIFFYGFSLGTGIATELALREPSAGLILRAPFTSIRGMIWDWYPRLRPLLMAAPWLPLTNFDTLAKIRRIDRPLLVMHGDSDQTVPEHMGQRIFEAALEPKTYVSFPDGGHSDISVDLVVPAITGFIDGVLGQRATGTVPEGSAAG
ncbi:MAG: alpha/beta hydrolase [Chloroflexota bacterium]|nr:alpha/beta hydrolase [Chloroflexota bacterium]